MLGSGYNVIIFDPSRINKSGKHTFQKGCFWSGCAKSMKEGLEISGIAIGDVDNHTAFIWRQSKSLINNLWRLILPIS